jgi:hypothetical protein
MEYRELAVDTKITGREQEKAEDRNGHSIAIL